jgi:hypothetical protein
MMRWGFGLVVVAMALWGCGDDDDSPRPTPSATPSVVLTSGATATPTLGVGSATPSATPDRTVPPTATAPPTATVPPATVTATPTDTATPLPTATPAPPELLYLGVARADDLLQEPDGVDAEGRPIYVRAQGQGMMLVVEGRRGRARLSDQAYDPLDFQPGIEVLASRPLGDGSVAVCDYDPPLIGGVPGVDPLEFSDDQMVRDAIADLGCRFNDGTGVPRGRTANNACTRDLGGLYNFADERSEMQYCLPIAKAWAFPVGDTIVAARLRDVAGIVSAVSEIVIRVAGDQPFECDGGLGERVFTARTPGSEVVAAEYGKVSTDAWLVSPLRLCAGPDLGDGTHALTLRENAIFGIPLSDGSVLCAEFRSRGSSGVLDCGSSTAHDVYAAAELPSGRITVDTGLGLPAGTGSASLRLPIAFSRFSGISPNDCLEASVGGVVVDALTTATATAEVLDEAGAVVASLMRRGAPFSCDDWVEGGDPVLVLPAPATDTVGAVAAALVLVD